MKKFHSGDEVCEHFHESVIHHLAFACLKKTTLFIQYIKQKSLRFGELLFLLNLISRAGRRKWTIDKLDLASSSSERWSTFRQQQYLSKQPVINIPLNKIMKHI
jgi:hypothetical protein